MVRTSKREETTNKNDLSFPPPLLGQVGAVIFFAILFANAHPTADGYAQFRKCHGNCVNGILHAIGMPLAVQGVFLIIRSVSDAAEFTRYLQCTVVTLYLYLYLQYETNPYSPWIFYVFYMSFFEWIGYQRLYQSKQWNRQSYLVTGMALVIVNVGALEAIGHGSLYENHHSYVSEFFNSVFHTPLYGINSILTTLLGYERPDDHTCWW